MRVYTVICDRNRKEINAVIVEIWMCKNIDQRTEGLA